MANPKDVLTITSSSAEGLRIKEYLKPVSAHIVAGTNLFNDFFADFTDIFGGRSQSYQKQLTSLYNEAIERLKNAAYEIGANCIIGLSIDMDEISGKGKSMFMLTAIGTAVIIEKESNQNKSTSKFTEKLENVGFEKIKLLRTRKDIIAKANNEELVLIDDVWRFLISNQVDELFPYLLKRYSKEISNDAINPGTSSNFHRQFIIYIDALPDDIKLDLLYNSLKAENTEQIGIALANIIDELNLFNFNKIMQLLKSDNFKTQKMGLRVSKSDKIFYNKNDIDDLQKICEEIRILFVERGKRSMKKQLLSSKEREVWSCECGKTNDIDIHCSGCSNDIYGFKSNEESPLSIDKYIQEKIELIKVFVE